ncbi:MAG: tRNA uridine-5-carboxymethylaminomethyl(34) synthesis GTPase MnmE [Alphaproteobacteria bacterium]|nr:tRNA uridine-5-carboxymethylaminomethyl(34) synthesis GTPase MnmE [Alphaproteobacteria bacterium]
MKKQTIYALSTVYGKSGVAVIRISGQNALNAIKALTNIDIRTIKPRHAYLTTLYTKQTKDPLDHALVLYFSAPHSFTGEDIVEIQCHGSKAVLSSLLKNLSEIEDFRLAEPGEFSKRAFYNQKMDLTEAEGLADLIDAETFEQQKQALRQMSGTLKNLYSSWREQLLEVYAYLEAYIDFPEENIPDSVIEKNLNTVFKLKEDIKSHLKSSVGERLREGFRVVLTGPTNAGKSSLINTVLERNAVIVSDIPGTTRDAIDVHLDISGYPVILTDTAGLRESTDTIEQQGIEIAREKIEDADFIFALFDASVDSPDIFSDLIKRHKNNILLVANKADKLTPAQMVDLKNQGCFILSAKTKEGVPELFDLLKIRIQNNIGSNSGALITRERYRQCLNDCLENLSNFNFDKEIELSAEDIRLAARALGKITGQIEIDEVLDKIFGSFCIGK